MTGEGALVAAGASGPPDETWERRPSLFDPWNPRTLGRGDESIWGDGQNAREMDRKMRALFG